MKKLLILIIAMLLAGGPSAAYANNRAKNIQTRDALRPIGVRIIPGSKVNLVSHESKLPIAITNDFDTEVRILLHVRPTTLAVTMPEVIAVTIPAQTTINAKVPISATSDGEVAIDAWLATFSGQRFGKKVTLQVSVSEDVELYLLLGFGGAVALLITVGVIRTLRRKSSPLKDGA